MSYTAQPVEVTEITEDWLAKTGYFLGYFSKRSRVAHLMIAHPMPTTLDRVSYGDALCNQAGGYIGEMAYGTGTQDEYEKARSLPLCPRCAHRALVRLEAS